MSSDNKQTAENGIGNGTAGPGRPAGSPNRVTGVLREAILFAAEAVGEDGDGAGGLEGYLRDLARNEKRAFAGLLGKVLPTQLNHSITDEPRVTKEQKDAAVSAAMRLWQDEAAER